MDIVLIEDNTKTAGFLQKGLIEHGFSVRVASDGSSGLDVVLTLQPKLVILDVMLPLRDGWSVLEEIRRSGHAYPVIILSARDAVEDRVKGLELGADDYLVKPFAFPELLARVKSVLRRGAVPQSLNSKLTVSDLEIDLLDRKVARSGRPIELTSREFALLVFLARRVGEVVSRREISKHVWDLHFDTGTNVVDVQIRRLRAKVDDGFTNKLIQTVRGMGYLLAA